MAQFPVQSYAAGWSPTTNKGRIFIKLAQSNAPTPLVIETSEEFIAILVLLSKGPVTFDSETQELELAFRPVGT